ncbi:hypothetical protein AXF42_Ash005348 [Apostasia shenzhenica]|uniref:Uncharacterized protein n=1 Tax=Apostasia shenzhenica TaxID=1088818 RepID=A0A2I0B6N4_9ASPA|nr:hypothetical protein AXF42_Ash005348 [Apostasia shenzhenica]
MRLLATQVLWRGGWGVLQRGSLAHFHGHAAQSQPAVPTLRSSSSSSQCVRAAPYWSACSRRLSTFSLRQAPPHRTAGTRHQQPSSLPL